MNYIDSLGSILAEPAVRNFNRWPILGVYVWPNNFIGNTYQEEITYMKNWILARTAWMDANMFGTCYSLGIDNSKSFIKIVPNPAQTHITVTGLPVNGTMVLTDFSGKIIKQIVTQESSTVIDLSELANGIYFLTETNNGIHEKIIKN